METRPVIGWTCYINHSEGWFTKHLSMYTLSVSNLLYSIANELASISLSDRNLTQETQQTIHLICLVLTGLTTKKFIVYTKVMVTIIKSQGLTPIISLYVRPHVADTRKYCFY